MADKIPGVGMHSPSRSTVAATAVGIAASTGMGLLGARNLLTGQAAQVRRVIPKSWDVPPRADGVYVDGGPVRRWQRGVDSDLHLMIFGDSTATGYGCLDADEVPGVLLARGLAQLSDKRIRLSTKALVGATSKGLSGQVDAMFVAGPPPDAAVIMIGANDVTALNGINQSARRLGEAVSRLRSSGAAVVVGTCPDFGVITAIPQPLRWVTRDRGLRLARTQARAVAAAGGVPVPLADLLTSDFRQSPELMFAADRYHPSATGYQLAAQQLLPALCFALGEATDELPWQPRTASSWSLGSRLGLLPETWRRPTTGVPAPMVLAAE